MQKLSILPHNGYVTRSFAVQPGVLFHVSEGREQRGLTTVNELQQGDFKE